MKSCEDLAYLKRPPGRTLGIGDYRLRKLANSSKFNFEDLGQVWGHVDFVCVYLRLV